MKSEINLKENEFNIINAINKSIKNKTRFQGVKRYKIGEIRKI